MRKVKCVDTRPPKESPIAQHKPDLAVHRRKMLEEYGDQAFLLPGGTPGRPGLPSYPIVSATTGCYHCGLMRMQYTRLGAAINRTRDKAYRDNLTKARGRLIELALSFADKGDRTNRCNWAFRASRRYL